MLFLPTPRAGQQRAARQQVGQPQLLAERLLAEQLLAERLAERLAEQQQPPSAIPFSCPSIMKATLIPL